MNRNIFIIVLFFSIWIICIGGCERDRKGDPIVLNVKNNTSDTVIFVTQYNYPDTTLINYRSNYEIDATTVNPYSKSLFYDFLGWEKYIIERNPNETLIIVVYSLDTMQKYSFQQIQSDYNILKRYDLNVNQLKAMSWTVTYP